MSNIKLKKGTTRTHQLRNAVLPRITLFYKGQTLKACVVVFAICSIFMSPTQAQAGFFSFLGDLFSVGASASEITTIDSAQNENVKNSQTVSLLEPALTTDLKNVSKDATVTIVGDEAIESKVGPLGTESDMLKGAYSSSAKINVYVVKAGDTLDSIAKSFNVTKQAIIYANSDIPKADLLKDGTSLVIIPLSGAIYTVKPTDTAESISKKYKISVADILEYNVLEKSSDLKAGMSIILVGVSKSALIDKPVVVKKPEPEKPADTTQVQGEPSGQIVKGFIWPFPAGMGRVSQKLHGANGMDMSAPKGTPILIAKYSGYNGGYGYYVVENFSDGTQSLYGHMSKVVAVQGATVKQGDIIGYVGSTGKSTGPHLHFERRGGPNPFKDLKVNNTSEDFHD
jgi:murein DD-endopeptidase MepM/ murein hydrolase activator NlpD